MPLTESLSALLRSAAYPHACDPIELVETHISWVLLTGDFAYKLKKPVRFPFVDFSTLDRRAHFCREELRCNRAFAPDLYLDVVPVTRGASGEVEMAGTGDVLEWAVKMQQFPPQRQLDRLLAADGVSVAMLRDFGARLAAQHQALPSLYLNADADLEQELQQRVASPIEGNFDILGDQPLTDQQNQQLMLCARAARADLLALRKRILNRLAGGFVRECHGDLHLSNLVDLEGVVTAFDCLEFNPNLRWIDTVSDIAFLFMDCLVRGRADLGYAFIDGYMDTTGDYEGLVLLPFFAAYRSMVRAKVAALQLAQVGDDPDSRSRLVGRLDAHLDWGARRSQRGAPKQGSKGPPASPLLVLMCGLSGSGKSYVATRLVPQLGALRLRSDVLRKTQAGQAGQVGDASQAAEVQEADSGSSLDQGRYVAERVEAVYASLADLSVQLLRAGETVILDATFLSARRRRMLLELAGLENVPAVVAYCDAPLDVLRGRVASRAAKGDDASEAGLPVLEAQRQRFEEPQRPEPVLRVDTDGDLDIASLAARLRAVGAQATSGGSPSPG